MARVLIVGEHAELNAIVEDAGYGVAVCSDTTLALSLLRVSARPVVVLLTHNEQTLQWRQVLTAARALPPHAYIVLSSQPQQIPMQWNVHTQRFIPVVPVPVEWKLLLTRIAEVARRLRNMTARTAAANHQYHQSPPRSRDEVTRSERGLTRVMQGVDPERAGNEGPAGPADGVVAYRADAAITNWDPDADADVDADAGVQGHEQAQQSAGPAPGARQRVRPGERRMLYSVLEMQDTMVTLQQLRERAHAGVAVALAGAMEAQVRAAQLQVQAERRVQAAHAITSRAG